MKHKRLYPHSSPMFGPLVMPPVALWVCWQWDAMERNARLAVGEWWFGP